MHYCENIQLEINNYIANFLLTIVFVLAISILVVSPYLI